MDSELEAIFYKVKLPQYEGPFNLLLNLIEEKKLFINEISLSQVTEDFLNYIRNLERFEPQKITSFLVVATTLILIKSKSLLPNLNLTEEEKEDIQNLEDRLKLFEFYSGLSENLKNIFAKKIIFDQGETNFENKVFVPDSKITKENMLSMVQNVLMQVPKKEKIPEVEVKKVISIEQVIDNLTRRIEESIRFSFSNFAPQAKTREEKVFLIVSFLAVLELSRQGILNLIQENNFDEIVVEKMEVLEV